MKKDRFNINTDNKTEKKDRSLMQELIARYFQKKLESNEEDGDAENQFESDKVYHKVIDAIHSRQSKVVRLRRNLRIAASVALFISLLGGVYYYYNIRSSSTALPVAMIEKAAAKGQTLAVTLPDGTQVWLNAESKLSYPENFKGEERKVTLTGEAYFEVVHLDNKPFIIHAGDIKTVVLGTKFNIKAYPQNPATEVTVVSGKVSVTAQEKEQGQTNTVYVTHNQKATYSKMAMELQADTNINAEEAIGWRTGRMIYRATAVKQVIEEVERKYNVTIIGNDKISHCTITVDFDNEELRKVLAVMAKLVNGTATYRNGIYYLEGNGCE